jgi:hypothetical protein
MIALMGVADNSETLSGNLSWVHAVASSSISNQAESNRGSECYAN